MRCAASRGWDGRQARAGGAAAAEGRCGLWASKAGARSGDPHLRVRRGWRGGFTGREGVSEARGVDVGACDGGMAPLHDLGGSARGRNGVVWSCGLTVHARKSASLSSEFLMIQTGDFLISARIRKLPNNPFQLLKKKQSISDIPRRGPVLGHSVPFPFRKHTHPIFYECNSWDFILFRDFVV